MALVRRSARTAAREMTVRYGASRLARRRAPNAAAKRVFIPAMAVRQLGQCGSAATHLRHARGGRLVEFASTQAMISASSICCQPWLSPRPVSASAPVDHAPAGCERADRHVQHVAAARRRPLDHTSATASR